MPARPGHAHSEDLPRLEVPQSLLAAEEEPGGGGSVVPSICGEALKTQAGLTETYTKQNRNHEVSQHASFFSLLQRQKKYKSIKNATTVVQSYTRGWQVRRV